MLKKDAIEAIKSCADISIVDSYNKKPFGVGMTIDDQVELHYLEEQDEIWLVVDNEDQLLVTDSILSGFKQLLENAKEKGD